MANAPPLFNSSLSFSLDEKSLSALGTETKNQAKLNSSLRQEFGGPLHPSDRSITPGMKRGDLFEMRKGFYNDVSKTQTYAPLGERSRGMTLEEMREELLGK